LWVVACLVLAVPVGGASADPSEDAVARLNELSKQALEAREAVTAAQTELNARRAEQAAAEERHRADLAALEAANAELEPLRAGANRIAAMMYMSGPSGQLATVLTATSPQQLIDRLALQHTVTRQVGERLAALRSARERAAAAVQASEKSAAEARAAAEQAAKKEAELKARWTELLRQISAAEAQFAALTPQQQEAVVNAAAPAPAPEAPAEPLPAPEQAPPVLAAARADIFNLEALPVSKAKEAGLQPNTVLVARAISAMFPQISEIGGVRPDSLPWHPSGLAIDVMIPNPYSPEGIALGNEIMNFVLSNAAQFGVQDVIWRGTYYTPSGPAGSGYGHFDHVHVTTYPRR